MAFFGPFILILIMVLAGQEPGIGSTYYGAGFDTHRKEHTVVCLLPQVFQSSVGKMVFDYGISNGWLDITVCNGGSGVTKQQTSSWATSNVDIECHSSMNITFTAVSLSVFLQPDIRIDNIKVYENFPEKTDSPSTNQNPTMALTQTTSWLSTIRSTQMTSSYKSTKDPPASKPDSTPMISSYQGTTDVPTSKFVSSRRIDTTLSETPYTAETTQNSTFPSEENPSGGAQAAIISVSVIGIFLMIVVTSVILIVNHRHRMPKSNGWFRDPGKRSGDNVYANAAFTSTVVEINQPDVIREAHLNSGLQGQHHPSSLANPQGPLSHLQGDECNGYTGLNNSTRGQGDYTDLKSQEGVVHQDEDTGQEYFVLEGPGDMDSDGQGRTGATFTNVEEQAYDHLNRGISNGNNGDELPEGHYGAVAVMSDEDQYNALVHGNEEVINQRSSKDRTNSKMTVPESGQDAGNEYQTLGLVDENDAKRCDDIDDNHYNVLGETEEDRMESSAKTSKDITSSDDYHILHSGMEINDYHIYQHPDQELDSGPAKNDTSKLENDEDIYHYPIDGAQGKEMAKGNIESIKEPLSQGEGDDCYSVVNIQGQVDTSGDSADKQHEPIYSSDVYSELM